MSIQLRPYQEAMAQEIMACWQLGLSNLLGVLPTGGGKTVVYSDLVYRMGAPACVIAHRKELVAQTSLALARNGVRHRIVGPIELARLCARLQLDEGLGCYVDSQAGTAVAGVDTLIRCSPHEPWIKQIKLVVQDEAHHVLRNNKWGRAFAMFPQAKHLGVTATPLRADGQGLGKHADGIFEHMVCGPTMRDLILMGSLTDYRIYAPPSDLRLDDVPLSASGDFSPRPLARAVHKSHIVGDVVAHYLRFAKGKRGVTFAVDVEAAKEIAQAYRDQGVRAEMVCADTDPGLRNQYVRKLRQGELDQLVNVDLFGEGFDLPTIEVVSFARPTQSFGLYAQQFGRVLRPSPGKEYGIVIDHVGNVSRHGLPDAYRRWSLDRRDKRAKSNTESAIPIRVCVACSLAYERVHAACPYCGHTPEPANRSDPKYVDGDLVELDAQTLERLRGQIDKDPAYHPDPIVRATIAKHHRDKMEAQTELRAKMAQWGGAKLAAGDTLRQAQRRFYLHYGVDVLTAQTLNAREARELMERIQL